MTSITIGSSVSSIGEDAFNGCSGLTSITIPEGVATIGSGAFSRCTSLTSVTINSNAILSKDYSSSSSLLSIFGNQVNTYTIGNAVTSIGKSAFNGCSNLTSITIPNSVTSIGDGAFGGCSGLKSFTIPEGVASIGNDAFSGCTSLTSVTINSNAILSKNYSSTSSLKNIFGNQVNTYTIGNAVTSIGNYAFNSCSGLTSISIPNSVTSIGNYAFQSCSGLTSVTIPESVTNIGEYAFRNCSKITSATIGSKVRSIGVGIFARCSKLETLSVASDNAVYDSRENCNAIIESSSNTLIAGCKSTIIPESVTSIGNDAFSGCSGLTSITIPNSVTSIGGSAFEDCSGLTSVSIPNSVTSIGKHVFWGCSGLTSVTIPNSVTNIGSDAFYKCTEVTDVYCYANPAGLTWDEGDCDDFKGNGSTNCHVFNTADWSGFGGKVNVTFVGDLAIDFADNADNSTSISTWKEDGRKVNARLKGRTLYKDGAWNTLCLPFDVDDFAGTPLEGATVMTFSDASFAAGTLTLNFAEVTSLTAGEPFIVKWPVGTDIANPVFKDVYISTQTVAKETDVVTFQGIYAPLKIEGEDNTLLYVGAGDKLYWPNAAMSIGAFRAYFRLNGGLTVGGGSSSATIRRTVLNFGDDATGIASPKSSPEGKDFGSPLLQEGQGEALYDLSGRRVNSPLAPGIYIRNGKKIIVK